MRIDCYDVHVAIMRSVLLIGIVAGGIIVATSMIVLAFIGNITNLSANELDRLELLGYARYLVLFVAVYLAIRSTARHAASPVSRATLLQKGLVCAGAAAMFVGALEFAYIRFLNPQFFEQYGTIYLDHLQQRGASPEELASASRQLDALSWMRSPMMMGLFYAAETFVVGTVAAVLIAAVIKQHARSVRIGSSPGESIGNVR